MVALVMAIGFFVQVQDLVFVPKPLPKPKYIKSGEKIFFFMKFNFSVDENLLLTYHSGTISFALFYRLGISFLASSENSIF